MLPKGAVHLPFKGIAKIARSLGFDYAEAVTGFEFKKRRAFPVIEGVVVARENEAALLDAYWEAEQDAKEKARVKQEERVLKQWTRLVQGLRIRQRLQEQYATKPDEEQSGLGPNKSGPNNDAEALGGGFLTAADDVVQPFHLPKFQYPHGNLSFDLPPTRPIVDSDLTAMATAVDEPVDEPPRDFTSECRTMDTGSDMEEMTTTPPAASGVVPKTMQEMAESAARQLANDADAIEVVVTDTNTHRPSASSTSGSVKQSRRPATRSASARKRGRGYKTEGDTSDDSGSLSSPKKRTRARESLTSLTPPTRTLRPRASKTPVQIQEEKQQEKAFRRAIAR